MNHTFAFTYNFKRDLSLELNKLHGFHRMSFLSENEILPCVRAKYYSKNTSLNEDLKYSVKIVKDYPNNCKKCDKLSCSFCPNYNPFEDYDMDYNINLSSKELKKWINKYNQTHKNNDFKFFYYKYFVATIYGKLLVTKKGYFLELFYNDDSGKKIYYERISVAKNSSPFLFIKSKHLTISQILNINEFVKKIEIEFSPQLLLNYSVLFDVAFSESNYFESDYLNETGIIFYGLRTYKAKNEISFDEYK